MLNFCAEGRGFDPRPGQVGEEYQLATRGATSKGDKVSDRKGSKITISLQKTSESRTVTDEENFFGPDPAEDRTRDPLNKNPTLYRVAIKVGLYRKAVQACYIPLPCDMELKRKRIKKIQASEIQRSVWSSSPY